MRSVRRRKLLLAAGALAAAPLVRAQKPGRIPSLGLLSHASSVTPAQRAASPLTAKLKSLGWVLDENLRFEGAFADGRLERLPELAADLVARGVDVILTVSPPAAVAAARATRTIPIVFARVVWPIELGLADSLVRPGRNVTGVASIADPAILAKPFEFLREIAPTAKRLSALLPHAVIYQTVSGGEFSPRLSTAAVDGLGFDVVRRFVRSVADLDAALADALTSRSEALFVSSSPLLVGQARRIAEFARRHRLPSAFIESLFVEAGGLVSYGSSVWGTIFDSLEYVDAILRGANPAELPIKLPTQMELAINLGVARELGLTVPRSILLRADRIVE